MTSLLQICWDRIQDQFPSEIKQAGQAIHKYEKTVHNTHHGFEPMGSVTGRIREPEFGPNSEVFVLVREARFCINSHFFFIENHLRGDIPNFPSPRNRRAFMLSDWGAPRYCNFLNHMNNLRGRAKKFEFLFY
jgi:hypothetical protein